MSTGTVTVVVVSSLIHRNETITSTSIAMNSQNDAQDAKRQRVDDVIISGGSSWRKCRNIGRVSWPGAPPKERKSILDLPYFALTPQQKAAAQNVMGIVTEDDWESSVPRRVYGNHVRIVCKFQPVPWKRLSVQQQDEASRHLGITPSMWDHDLAPFHDELWQMEGFSLTPNELESVLAALTKMSRQPHEAIDLVTFLLGLGRVLTPSQGLLIVRTLQDTVWWDHMDGRGRACFDQNIHLLVASFLCDPARFVNFASPQLLVYWDDETSGCTWGNARVANPQPNAIPYAMALQQRRDRPLAFRRCVGPILVGSIPTHLPNLPKGLAKIILFEWIGEEEDVDPHKILWLKAREFSVASLL